MTGRTSKDDGGVAGDARLALFAAETVDLPIDPACLPGVAANLAMLVQHGRRLLDGAAQEEG